MTAVLPNEVTPGIVIHCNPEALKHFGGCKIKVEPGRETLDKHYFLVVEIDVVSSTCLATPLFSEKHGIRDRILLNDELKSGKRENWMGENSYYFKWQFWTIPLGAFQDASLEDNSSSADRRFYGRYSAQALADVVRDIGRLREPWRAWGPN